MDHGTTERKLLTPILSRQQLEYESRCLHWSPCILTMVGEKWTVQRGESYRFTYMVRSVPAANVRFAMGLIKPPVWVRGAFPPQSCSEYPVCSRKPGASVEFRFTATQIQVHISSMQGQMESIEKRKRICIGCDYCSRWCQSLTIQHKQR
jgi:hypothetical protein